MLNKVTCLCVIAFTTVMSCSRDEKFPAIGDTMASPIDVATSESGEYFYVLNADFDRTYNQGSVVVLDQDGNKIKAVEVPRLGRSITATDKDLIVTTDYPDQKGSPMVMIFDITDPKEPVLKREFSITCSPLNVALRKGYGYFFVVCSDGTLSIGKLEEDRSQSWLKRVRGYARTGDTTKRALYLDTKRELLLGFTTDIGKQATADRESVDSRTFNDNAEEILNAAGEAVPDEIPDDMQDSPRAIASSGSRVNYQYFVYDIRAEKENAPGCTIEEGEDCKFPLRDNNDPVVKKELRWIYFHLNNFDGTPDTASALDPNTKYYRTNFWEAKPDPFDPDVFYLSHRGAPKKSAFSNQIVRVQFIGDLRVGTDGKVPHTGDVFTFERISGFKAEGQNGEETTKFHFPGDFELEEIAGQRVLVVNHFRDIGSQTWTRSEVYFSITAKTLDENSWFTELPGRISSPNITTFYQVAVNKNGRIMSPSFYSNAVMLLEVTPGVGIREIKRIE